MTQRFILLSAWSVLYPATGIVAWQEVAPQPSSRAQSRATSPDTLSDDVPPSASEAVRRAMELLDALEADDTDTVDNRLEKVTLLIDGAEANDPDNGWLYFLRGRVYALKGRQGDAIDEFRKFVDTPEGRNVWEAYRRLGDAFVAEYPRLAKASYEKAAELNPSEPDVLLGLSRCALKLGDKEEAARLARDAIAADVEGRARFMSHLAATLLVSGDLSEALLRAEEALRLAKAEAAAKPGSQKPLLTVDGQYQLLVAIVRRRINDASTVVADDYQRLARYVHERNEVITRLALHRLLRVIERGVEESSPDTPVALLEQYGVELEELGRVDEAVGAFRKILKREPDHAVAKDWLKRLSRPPDRPPPPQAP